MGLNLPTTDNQAEVFDVVNEHDEVIGQATRGECHRDPNLTHRGVEIFVVNARNQIFLQKRSPTKDLYPNCWTFSTSGHVDAGHTYVQAAVKELKEEIGLRIDPAQLIVLKEKKRFQNPYETEFGNTYVVYHEGPFVLHPEEITEGKWFDLAEILALIQAKTLTITAGFAAVMEDAEIITKLRALLMSRNAQSQSVILVDAHDNPIGKISKLKAHLDKGQRHRAFTAILHNHQGQWLVTKRSLKKPLWPAHWDISFSSHPWDGEDLGEASKRRAFEELGLIVSDFKPQFQFEYHQPWNELFSEWEVNHVLMGSVETQALLALPYLNSDEISDYRWLTWPEITTWYHQQPEDFAYWVGFIVEKLTQKKMNKK